MRLSRYFLPILKENPQDAATPSHQLMVRSGMIRQLSSGIYNWLPLGSRVLKKIENIVRCEMDRAGAVEIIMPMLQPSSLWQESGRYDDYGQEMLKVVDRHQRDMLFGPTAEEVVTDIFRQNVKSYKDLPLNLYQIQWKFRDEIRPRFGIMRGREFVMKDAYSFDADYESARQSYNIMFKAYIETFKAMGLTAVPVRADNGAIGGDLSHEFQVLADTGESQVYYDRQIEDVINNDDVDIEKLHNLYAAADEMHEESKCHVSEGQLCSRRGIEVGHIFYFGEKYTKALNASVMGNDGKPFYPHMGSYGIGVSRLVGAIIESSHDRSGIIWPDSVAPFKVGLINIKPGDEASDKACDELYNKLEEQGIDVLYADNKESAGWKFATMDLIGLPWQIAIGPRSVKDGKCELKNRKTGEKQEVAISDAMQVVVG